MLEHSYAGRRILVTGGAGFLGSNLVKRLMKTAERIYVLDDLYTGRRDAVPQGENVVFVQGSVTDGALVRQLLADVDTVFHFAARNITLSVVQPESDFRVNVEGTVQLLLGSLPHKKRLHRIVYASTSSIYGNSPQLPAKEGTYDIGVPYAASKFSGEIIALAYARMYGLPVTCLRFSNVFGPGQDNQNPYCGVVTKFMEAIYKGQPLTIYGDGTQTRDFTYVDDAMDAVLLAGASQATLGEVFNVGTGVEVTVNGLAHDVLAVLQKPEYPVVFAPKRAVDTVYRRAVDATKLRTALGWAPTRTLSEGIAQTWAWFQAHVAQEQGR